MEVFVMNIYFPGRLFRMTYKSEASLHEAIVSVQRQFGQSANSLLELTDDYGVTILQPKAACHSIVAGSTDAITEADLIYTREAQLAIAEITKRIQTRANLNLGSGANVQ